MFLSDVLWLMWVTPLHDRKEPRMAYLKRWQNKVIARNGGRGGSQGQIQFKGENPEVEDS